MPRASAKRPVAKAKTGQGDHGVAAPIREPVIACDNGVQTVAAPHQKLIGRPRQRLQQRVGGPRGAHHHLLTAVALAGEKCERVAAGGKLGGRNYANGGPGVELQTQATGHEQVLAVVEAALFLARILEVVVPVRDVLPARARGENVSSGLLPIGAIDQHVLGPISRWSHLIVGLHQVVIVPTREKGAQLQTKRARCLLQLVRDDQGVLVREQGQPLAQHPPIPRVRPRRHRLVREGSQPLVAPWMNDPGENAAT